MNTTTALIIAGATIVAVAIIVKQMQPRPVPAQQSSAAQIITASGSLLESLSHFSY